jgi:hypothetical protein
MTDDERQLRDHLVEQFGEDGLGHMERYALSAIRFVDDLPDPVKLTIWMNLTPSASGMFREPLRQIGEEALSQQIFDQADELLRAARDASELLSKAQMEGRL